MLAYLKTLIPNIQKYSKKLDQQSVFINKPWLYVDENNNQHEYIFLNDSRLIMSLGGQVQEGKWELLPNGKLLINRVKDSVMLENMFIDDALMMLKMSGTDDIPFTLINQQAIPDLDAIRYLKDFQEISQSNDDGTPRLLSSGRLAGSKFTVGQEIKGINDEILTGSYLALNKFNQSEIIVEINKSIVKQIKYLVPYKYNENLINLAQSDRSDPQIGDDSYDPKIRNKEIEIQKGEDLKFRVEFDINGKIVRCLDISHEKFKGFLWVMIVILVLAFIVGILSVNAK
jgi:hypothetical protein